MEEFNYFRLALLITVAIYFFFPGMNALVPMLAFVFSFLYTEIFGKLYFRRKF